MQGAKWVEGGPFNRAEWFNLLSENPESNALFALAQADDGMAALALRRHEDRLDALTNWYAFTWGPMVSEKADSRPLLTTLARDLKSSARRVVLAPLAAENNSTEELENSFKSAGWIVFRSECDKNHFLRVNGRTYAEYLASRPGALRTTLARKSKKLDINIYHVLNDDIWHTYTQIYQQSWKPQEGSPDLLKRFAQQESDAGHLRLALAHHNGQPVGAQFWTVDHGTAYIHKLAHLPEAQSLSAGTVLTAALMKHVIDIEGVELVDFGTGNDTYKADWMELVRPRFELDCYDPGRLLNWPYIARAALHLLATRKSAG
ncbi:hypothetical protein MB02_13400 [Croceicoccus estronivorus]|nr:hypothetical protein MB02_13400 [Croceicoccus estronivorus]